MAFPNIYLMGKAIVHSGHCWLLHTQRLFLCDVQIDSLQNYKMNEGVQIATCSSASSLWPHFLPTLRQMLKVNFTSVL